MSDETNMPGARKLTLVNPEANQKIPPTPPARAKKGGKVALEWDDDNVELAKATLMRNLFASKRFFDKSSGSYIDVPDGATQIAAAVAICNQALGLPLQRMVKMDMTFKDRHSELMDAAATPSGREMLLRAGLIDREWLGKYFPAESQQGVISQAREKS